MVSKVISLSEKVNSLSLFGRLLYTWMIPHADDFGRLPGSPAKIKHMVVPFADETVKDVERELADMHRIGIIIWYEIGGERFVQVVNFEDHQQGLHKRTKSKFPEPPDEIPAPPPEEPPKKEAEEAPSDAPPEEFPGDSRNVPGNSEKFPLNRTELNRTEGNGTEAEGNAPATAATGEVTQTIMDVHKAVFGTLMMNELMSTFVRSLLNKGLSESFVTELMLETGETATKPSLRYMQNTAERWIANGITTREQAASGKAPPPPQQRPFQQAPARTGSATPSAEETRAHLDEMDELRRRKQERLMREREGPPPGGLTHGS